MSNRTIKGWVTNKEEICGAWSGLQARENVSSQKRKSCNSTKCKDNCNTFPILHDLYTAPVQYIDLPLLYLYSSASSTQFQPSF